MKKELILFLLVCPLIFFYIFSSEIRGAKAKKVPHVTLHDSFEQLEGIGTTDWSYIQTKKDYEDLEFYKTLYEKNKDHQFNSSPTLKIPKTVHLIWVGPRPFPMGSVKTIRSWMAHHPDWTFKFWTDRPRPAPCNNMEVYYVKDFNFEFLKEKFEESTNWGEKADLWRYEILHQEGGVYIDHDAECLRPFHGLHTGYDFYACLEMPHEGIEERALTAGIGIIGSRPRHPVLRRTIQVALDRWDEVTKRFSSNDPLVRARRVTHRSYIAMTYALKDHLSQPGNTDIVFPACYFYPQQELPGFYSVHHYGTTWNDLFESEEDKYYTQALRSLRRRDAKILRVELLSLLVIIASFIIYFLTGRQVRGKQ